MHFILMTTATCCKCKTLKPMLSDLCEKHNIPLDILDASDPKVRILIDTYNIMQVPVLFCYDSKGDMIDIMKGDIYIQNVEKLIEENQVI